MANSNFIFIDSPNDGLSDWPNHCSEKSNVKHLSKFEDRLMNCDAISLGTMSMASIWSNCTNISFDKFLNDFDPKSKIHKSMLVVLSAIREAIESQNGNETETEYFAGFMVALSCVDSEEKLTAILALIQMVLKRLPEHVLKLKFNETASALMKILNEYIILQSNNGYLIKSIINALSIFLKNLDEILWEQTFTQKIFKTILSLIFHIKPRVRKAAKFSVISIVSHRDVLNDSKNLIARKLAAEFCISKMMEHLTTTTDEHLHILLYTLSLLSDILFLFPSVKYTQEVCETILTHMKLGNLLIVNSSLQTLYSFFLRRPNSKVLSAELNGQLMNALYECQPNMNDEQLLKAWCSALKECLLSLHNLNRQLSHLHLEKFIHTMLNCLQSDSSQVHVCICNSIKVAFNDIFEEDFQSHLLEKLFTEFESSLKYKFSQSWIHVIPMLSEFLFDNEQILQQLTPIFERMAILHESNDSEINKAIDNFFAKAVATYGPQVILKQCPINWISITESENSEFSGQFTNPWLLPIIRDYAHNKTHLGLFRDHFLPMAENISKKSLSCKKTTEQLQHQLSNAMETDGDNSTFRAHESLLVAQRELKRCEHALWTLFPAFCRNPVDVSQVFSK